jgi:hypothetical protein
VNVESVLPFSGRCCLTTNSSLCMCEKAKTARESEEIWVEKMQSFDCVTHVIFSRIAEIKI